MKTLYIVRHGQTNLNIENRYQGQIDVELNEEGENQARKLEPIIGQLDIGLIIVSPTKRTRRTLELFNLKNIATKEDPAFLERNMGVYEGLTREEAKQKYPKLWDQNVTRTYNLCPTLGETIEDMEKRIFPRLEEIKKLNKNILIVTHGMTSRIINKYFNPNISEEDFFNFALKNAEIKEYRLF